MIRTVRLALTQRPDTKWRDAFTTTAPAETPFIVSGMAAELQFGVHNVAGAALASVTGLTLITMEVYANRRATAAIIAPPVFAGTLNEALTLAQWNNNTTPYFHFNFTLTGAQTTVEFEDDADGIDAWLEVYATSGGQRTPLGSGPLRIHRSAAGGTPPGSVSQYYTQAQVDALLADRPEITVTDFTASFSSGGVTYSFPVGPAQ